MKEKEEKTNEKIDFVFIGKNEEEKMTKQIWEQKLRAERRSEAWEVNPREVYPPDEPSLSQMSQPQFHFKARSGFINVWFIELFSQILK